MAKLYIIRKGKPAPFELPSKWRLLSFAAFPERGHVHDARAFTRESLGNPIGSRTLAETLSPRNRVAILVEDITRASPKGFIYAHTLQEAFERVSSFPPELTVHVIPSGGVILPMFESDADG